MTSQVWLALALLLMSQSLTSCPSCPGTGTQRGDCQLVSLEDSSWGSSEAAGCDSCGICGHGLMVSGLNESEPWSWGFGRLGKSCGIEMDWIYSNLGTVHYILARLATTGPWCWGVALCNNVSFSPEWPKCFKALSFYATSKLVVPTMKELRRNYDKLPSCQTIIIHCICYAKNLT